MNDTMMGAGTTGKPMFAEPCEARTDTNQPEHGSPNLTQWVEVQHLLREQPELARSPSRVHQILPKIPIGSAKRLLKRWRDTQQKGPSLTAILGPTLHQNVRIVGTIPDTVSPGSPPLSAWGPWQDRGDNKLTATVDVPHLEGHAELVLSATSLELRLAATRGFTSSEILLILDFLRPPFDPAAEVRISNYEVFRDAKNARFDGVQARTYQDARGLWFKAYNHEDSRGLLARIEIRPPAVKVTYDEIAEFFEGKQPLGRDSRLDALTAMVRDNSTGLVELKRAVRTLARWVEKLADSNHTPPESSKGRP